MKFELAKVLSELLIHVRKVLQYSLQLWIFYDLDILQRHHKHPPWLGQRSSVLSSSKHGSLYSKAITLDDKCDQRAEHRGVDRRYFDLIETEHVTKAL